MSFEFSWLPWLGVVLCIGHSAMFSGLNLAYFSVSRLRLEAEAQSSPRAQAVLEMRRNSNYLLTTILWGNVATNTLLALISGSLMTGVAAFVFSTFVITFLGEICPQAYCSRRALRVASAFAPVLRFYQWLLYPVAKPSALMLDLWLGHETIDLMREKTLRHVIEQHMTSATGEIDAVEGLGALNFLELDDMLAAGEGQPVDLRSIIVLQEAAGKLQWPQIRSGADDPLLQQIHLSGKKWVIFTNPSGEPVRLLNADEFLRAAVFDSATPTLEAYCHSPIVVRDGSTPLGDIIALIKHHGSAREGLSMDQDVALVWNDSARRVITGSDILADLLRGLTLSKEQVEGQTTT